MKGPLIAALAAGSLAAVAFGGIAMAAEAEDPGLASVTTTQTSAPDDSGDETSDDVSTPDAEGDDGEHGLVCILVPIETADEGDEPEADGESTEVPVTAEEVEPTAADDDVLSIDQLLAANDIECSGTGNERSSEVALVPRYLAHSDDYTGHEKGLAVSAWAKSKSQKNAQESSEPTDPEAETPAENTDPEQSVAPASPGHSGESHGNSGAHGQGHGH